MSKRKKKIKKKIQIPFYFIVFLNRHKFHKVLDFLVSIQDIYLSTHWNFRIYIYIKQVKIYYWSEYFWYSRAWEKKKKQKKKKKTYLPTQGEF